MARPSSNFVLVVDDSALARMILCGELIQAGILVETARDAREALDMIERRRPAAVVTDVQMPGLDGFELLEVLRRRYPKLPVVMLSVDVDIEFRARAADLGAAGVLRKSNEHAPMVELVRKLADRNQTIAG